LAGADSRIGVSLPSSQARERTYATEEMPVSYGEYKYTVSIW